MYSLRRTRLLPVDDLISIPVGKNVREFALQLKKNKFVATILMIPIYLYLYAREKLLSPRFSENVK